MANEEELASISNELEISQARGESIRQQVQAMQSSLLEMASTIEALQNIGNAKKDTLVPIGAGVFLSCPKPDADRVVVSVGSGIMMEKKPEEAIKILESRQKKLSDAMNEAQKELARIVNMVEQLSLRAGELSAMDERAARKQ